MSPRRLAARVPYRGPAAPFACVALVMTPVPGGTGAPGDLPPWQLLLIERARRDGDPWSGHMALPGGRVDPGDADPLATAIRETAEETGVEVCAADLLGELDDVHPLDKTAAELVVRPFAFELKTAPPLTLSDEVATTLWVPLSELLECACTAEVDARGGKLSVPAYRCGPHVVWGMTHRIIDGMLAILASRPE